MSDRFFCPSTINSSDVILASAEAHHLLHVMRASVGQSVTLFDDSGAEFDAVVDSLGRNEAHLRIVGRREVDRELPFPLTVGVALPKGDRQKWLVEKLTELGVSVLVPLITQRGIAQPSDATLDRLRRGVIEASKQCGRNRLMSITQPEKWKEWIRLPSAEGLLRFPDQRTTLRRLVAHPGGVGVSALDLQATLPTFIAIGPEGGFTNEEVAVALDAGWQQVDLGPRVLRVETAAIALAAIVVQHVRV